MAVIPRRPIATGVRTRRAPGVVMVTRTPSSTYARTVRLEELVELSLRLASEFPEYPPGSVMRCVARVAWSQRRVVGLGDPLAVRCEVVARRLLSARHDPGRVQVARAPIEL
jgi:hypothetical protein